MKIAVLSYYSGHNFRGNETFVASLSSQLAKKHSVKVWSASERPFPFSKYTPGWRTYLDPQSLAIKRFTQGILAKLDKDTDIIIATNGGWQSLLCRLWCWRNGARLIISGQSGPGWDDRINLLCRPDAFVALTNFQADWARKNGLGVNVVKIPNGVDLERFNPQIKPVEIDLPRPIFLCVAALENDKRVDLTIKAVSRLGRGSLIVLGDGSKRQEIAELCQKFLPNRLLISQVSHQEVPKYFAAANVVTMTPVPTESFGIIYLEALACGKPVVATDDPIRREIIGDAGLFIEPENTQGYAAALQKALDTDWKDKPRKQAEKFSWEEVAKKYDQLFRHLTGL